MYVVVFRSLVRGDADRDLLRALDEAAHLEAVESGGLIDYVAGSDDGARASVCIWRSRADAKRAATLPHHMEAVRHAHIFYEWHTIQTYGDELGSDGMDGATHRAA